MTTAADLTIGSPLVAVAHGRWGFASAHLTTAGDTVVYLDDETYRTEGLRVIRTAHGSTFTVPQDRLVKIEA